MPQWEETIKTDANTDDVLNGVLACVRIYSKSPFAFTAVNSIKEYCRKEGQSSQLDFLKALYEWACRNIDYKLDPEGNEILRTPDLSVNEGNADCKKFCILLGSVLVAAGIEPIFKHVFYKGNKNYSHIYIIIPNPDLTNYITLDCTLDNFNEQVKYETYCLYTLNGTTMPSTGYKLTMMGAKDNSNNWGSDVATCSGSVLDTMKGVRLPMSGPQNNSNNKNGQAWVAFLSLVQQNANGLASTLLYDLANNPTALNTLAAQYGGSIDELKQSVLTGSNIPPNNFMNASRASVGGGIDTQYSG